MSKNKQQKLFKIDLVSRTISQLGDTMFYPVMLTIAAGMPDPKLAMLLVSLSEGVPIFLGVLIGAIADNTREKYRAMQWLNALRFILYLIASIFFFKSLSFGFYVTLVINFISDCLGKGYTPLANALFMSYTDKEEIQQHQAILSAWSSLISAIGPLIGSSLLLIMGESWIVLINAGTFLLSSICFAIGKKEFQLVEAKIATEQNEKQGIIATLRKGLEVLFSNKLLLAIICFSLMINLLFSPIQKILLPLRVTEGGIETIGTFAFTMSLIMGSVSVGIIGGAMLTQLIKRSVSLLEYLLGIFAIAIIIILVGVSGNTYVIIALMFILGIIIGVVNTLFSTAMMKKTPAKNIGVVSTVVMLIAAGGMVFGDILATFFLNFFTTSLLITLSGLLIIIFIILFAIKNKKSLREQI